MTTYEEFRARFIYKPELAGYVGVEREYFLKQDCYGFGAHTIVPKAVEVLNRLAKGIEIQRCFGSDSFSIPDPSQFGYELSRCQVESRDGPCMLCNIKCHLQATRTLLQVATHDCGLQLGYENVGPEDMPLDVYPDPTGRYQKITKNMPREVLLAACRVIGTHVHIGMSDHETALKVYNRLCAHVDELCELGNGSFGERLAIYRQMAPDWCPMPYESWQHFYDVACQKGFADDPRKCWTLIRISVHGTIEFRMFGATDSIPRIVSWATRCHELCLKAL